MPDYVKQAIDWTREWQALIGGFLALVASIIFAIASIASARIRAGANATASARSLKKSQSDLRVSSRPPQSAPAVQPLDIVKALEHLRSLVRSALSALTPNTGSVAGAAAANQLTYERILGLELERMPLPAGAPVSVQDHLASLGKQMETLRTLLNQRAPTAEVANSLIKINTLARNLTQLLTPSAPTTKNTAPVAKTE